MMWLVMCMITLSAAAQTPATVTFDPDIPFSTIIREDLFAGFLNGRDLNGERFRRGEANLEILLAERPQDRPGLLAWKGGIALKRATDAIQAGRKDEFQREYRKATELYSEAAKLAPGSVDVMAVTGAGLAIFADGLPEPYRQQAWGASYKAYRGVWQAQSGYLEKLPLHFQGELLAGVAQSAQRTGRATESAQFLKKILETMPGTPYAMNAKKWIDAPGEAGKTKLVCETCHDTGRLEERRPALAKRQKQ
jgi:hypothetical protein